MDREREQRVIGGGTVVLGVVLAAVGALLPSQSTVLFGVLVAFGGIAYLWYRVYALY